MMATLFIGMPVHNGETFIEQAIESLIHQTYSDWTLLISDNDSKDATASICDAYCRKDKRIHYVKQNKNIGAMNNFLFLLQSADTPYFMWAAADDEWAEVFVEACINGLNRQNAEWAFTNMVNIDSFGRIIREYGSFNYFATDDQTQCVINYVLSPEVFGKANLIYGIYRLPRLKEVMVKLLSSPWIGLNAYDMVFNLGILCRAKLFIDERVLFHKRHIRQTDSEKQVDEIIVDKPYLYGTVNHDDFHKYMNAMIEASKGTEYGELVLRLMEYRQRLQDDTHLFIEEHNLFIQELNKEMAIRIEEATWKFAKWTWLKRLLKYFHSLQEKYFVKANRENEKTK